MKTRRKARNTGRTFLKSGRMEKTSKQFFPEYECDVRDQTLSQFYKHSEIQ